MKPALVFCVFLILFLLIPSDVQAIICSVGSATGNDTSQIQSAIDTCSGGGEVRLTSGQTYMAGTIRLRNGVTFNLNGATVEASNNPADFDSSTPHPYELFYVGGVRGVSIVGPGVVKRTARSADANDAGWTGKFSDQYGRIAMIAVENSSNIEIENVEIITKGAPYYPIAWGFHLPISLSQNVTVDKVTVRGNRSSGANDGIDVKDSQHVAIRNCDIDTWDDGIAISTRQTAQGGMSVDDVLVENCRIASSVGAIVFGSGTYQDIHNLTFKNITIHDTGDDWNGGAIKFKIRDGATLSNAVFSNFRFEPPISRILMCDQSVYGQTGVAGCIGKRESNSAVGAIRDICFENFTIDDGGGNGAALRADAGPTIQNIKFLNMSFRDGSRPLVEFADIDGLTIANFTSHLTGDPREDLSFNNVSNLIVRGEPMTCGGTPISTPGPSPTPRPSSTPTPTTPPIPGDLDGDGDVDIFDYNILVRNFGNKDCGNMADIDGDCDVDIFDYNILVENFGKII